MAKNLETNEKRNETYVRVCDDLIAINTDSYEMDVCIDPNIGKRIHFTIISEDLEKLSHITIVGPQQQNYDLTSGQCTKDPALKKIEWKLEKLKYESGIWRIRFHTYSVQTIYVKVLVLSQIKNLNAIRMKAYIIDANIDEPRELRQPPVIVAQILKGNELLIGAEVMATIDRPNGTQSELKLITSNDIYCNFFTDFCGTGSYVVTVSATVNASTFRRALFEGKSIEQFQRQEIIGAFNMNKNLFSTLDYSQTDIRLFQLTSSLLDNSLRQDFNYNISNETTNHSTPKSQPNTSNGLPLNDNSVKTPETKGLFWCPIPHSSGPNRETVVSQQSEDNNVLTINTKPQTELEYISICNEKITFTHFTEKCVIIDSDVGQNTIFTVEAEDMDKFDISILSPKGSRVYDSALIGKDFKQKKYQFRLKTAESGNWIIRFILSDINLTYSAFVSVLSQPLTPNPLLMRVTLNEANSDSNSVPFVTVNLTKGSGHVVNANVTAIVDKPDGTQKEIELCDQGHNYGRNICKFETKGTYNVTVLAKALINCSVKYPKLSKFYGPFQRQEFVGSFKIEKQGVEEQNGQPNGQGLTHQTSHISDLQFSEYLNENSEECYESKQSLEDIKALTQLSPNQTTLSNENTLNPDQIYSSCNELEAEKEKLLEFYSLIPKWLNDQNWNNFNKLTNEEKKHIMKSIEECTQFIANSAQKNQQQIECNRKKLSEILDKLLKI